MVTRVGTGADTSITSLEFAPDFVLIKDRDSAYPWPLIDIVRGATNRLLTNEPNAEGGDPNGLTAFTTDGYDLGVEAWYNNSNDNFLDLCLKAGADQGFYQEALISHTNGAATTVTHDLGTTITYAMVKRTDAAGDWYNYHTALGDGKYLLCNTTAGAVVSAGFWPTNTSTQFDIPSGLATGTYAVYLFADSDIFKAFSYIGNATTTDYPFVHLGGKPLSIPFWKNSEIVSDWHNLDAARNSFNPVDISLYPNSALAEVVAPIYETTFTSQGFKVASANNEFNGSGNLHIGLAILESTKYSNAY